MNTTLSFSLTSSSILKHPSLFLLPSITSSRTKLGFLRPQTPIPTSTFTPLSHPPLPSILHRDDEEDEDDDNEEDEFVAEEYNEAAGVSEEEDYDDDEDGFRLSSASSSASPAVGTTWSEEPKWKRVERLRSQVKELGDGIIDVEELASIYDFPIDKFQRLAILAFLRGSSVVVSAPTSSGKTLIAEAAAVATVARGRRLFYTTPLKALSNQKYRDFCGTFGDSNVGLLTGDAAVNKDAPILIMTTEILRNMLYQSVGMVSSGSGLLHVDVIVLDEVHYLSDISRGTVWEEIVIYCPKEVQLICLSATVANPDELAGWIGKIHGTTELVTSTKRPVPLTWHFSTKRSLLPLLDAKGNSMNRKLSLDYAQFSSSRVKGQKEDGSRKNRPRKDGSDQTNLSSISRLSQLSKNDINAIRRSQVPQIRDTLWQLRSRDMLPAIWFIFSRKGCDAAVQYLEDCNLLDECETDEVALALKRFRIQYPDAVREAAVKGLLQGVAAHHAGCLPLWKSFIEELFQRGLVKVIFATETLAAGINMPARTAVIASLSRRNETGRLLLSSNDLLQMAGRAGRRGIDERGHAVLVQTPYEGAEECCKILFAGLEPLVSQFTASYGMVLNLLAGAKITRGSKETNDIKTFQAGRTLEDARKLVEQSFGNYVGSNVMLAAKEEITKIQHEIEFLVSEVDEAAIDRKCREQLSEMAYREIFDLQEELRVAKRIRSELKKRMELERITSLKPLLKELENGQLPFICLQHKDDEAVQQFIPAVYLGVVNSSDGSEVKDVVSVDCSLSLDTLGAMLDCGELDSKLAYYVALGSNNCWYLFTEKWIKSIYKTGFPNVPLVQGDALPRDIMKGLLAKEELQWSRIADSEFGPLWNMEGSLETWSWSLNVPVFSSLSEDDEVLPMSKGYQNAVQQHKEQRRKVSQLKKKVVGTNGFKEFKKIIDATNFTKEKIKRLKARSDRLINRIKQIEPSGWKDFLQINNVIHEARALDINTRVIFPLGETAAAIRGENELWLAMVLRNKILIDLKPAELAAICGSLVSEGIKIRPWKNNSYIYESSAKVTTVIKFLDGQRSSFLRLQEKHRVNIPCELDGQFPGMVEAWASGLTWRELMMDCAMDEGDLSRLLRRTIDLLAQIPKLPDIDPLLQKNATIASSVMDRAPISELAS